MGSIETITAELQRLEQQKIVLTNEIQNHQVKQSEINITLDQMKEVLEEAKGYVLKNHDEMMKYILSRFIHKIIVKNKPSRLNTISVAFLLISSRLSC